MENKVVILQHRLLHYREGFFKKLKEKCAEKSINLHVVHGQASKKEKERKDEGFLKWADRVNNLYLRVGNRDILWQPFPSYHSNSDLIVIMQENRIISNYLLFIYKLFSPWKLAYWGHGSNFQSRSPNGLRERWKKLLINKVDWWFAYTKTTVDILVKSGVPSNKISNLNNSIDTSKFKEDYLSVSEKEVNELKDKIGIANHSKIGVFCGSLYKDKKFDLLLSAAEIIKIEFDFHLIIMGSGPELGILEEYSKTNPWLHLVGIKKGYEKALYYRLSDVMLNPGLLGLHILDSFSIGIPLVSTNNAWHSPEISYLDNGVNGILTEDNPQSYSDAILKLLKDKTHFDYIRSNALESGSLYTLDNMVDNFLDGILKALR